jgi:hypothetical protein
LPFFLQLANAIAIATAYMQLNKTALVPPFIAMIGFCTARTSASPKLPTELILYDMLTYILLQDWEQALVFTKGTLVQCKGFILQLIPEKTRKYHSNYNNKFVLGRLKGSAASVTVYNDAVPPLLFTTFNNATQLTLRNMRGNGNLLVCITSVHWKQIPRLANKTDGVVKEKEVEIDFAALITTMQQPAATVGRAAAQPSDDLEQVAEVTANDVAGMQAKVTIYSTFLSDPAKTQLQAGTWIFLTNASAGPNNVFNLTTFASSVTTSLAFPSKEVVELEMRNSVHNMNLFNNTALDPDLLRIAVTTGAGQNVPVFKWLDLKAHNKK